MIGQNNSQNINMKGIGENTMYKFCRYEVGKRYPALRTRTDEVQFDISDSSAVLVVKFNNPSDKERRVFESTNRFEIRSITLKGISYILVKFGGLDWMDAPYTPHLSMDLTHLPNLEEDESKGLALLVLLVDSSTGEVCKIRLIGLGNRFSRLLIRDVEELSQMPFDLALYDMSISDTYSRYTTPALVKLSSNYYKIN